LQHGIISGTQGIRHGRRTRPETEIRVDQQKAALFE
jgi:hypothetical protein